ncbi:MAG: hypothetical protein PHF00_07910 [Elusimicrobia bacterium]|nr:hypothetical protein [Elusimicrobiota bacterium]
MDTIMLISVFLSSLAVSACVVWIFSALMDGVLARLAAGETAAAWSLFTKFALFVVGFTGGLRLTDMEPLLASARPPINSAQILLEVFRAVTGALVASAWMLLVIFAAALAFSGGKAAYARLRPQSAGPREPQPSGVGAARHARSRENQENP